MVYTDSPHISHVDSPIDLLESHPMQCVMSVCQTNDRRNYVFPAPARHSTHARRTQIIIIIKLALDTRLEDTAKKKCLFLWLVIVVIAFTSRREIGRKLIAF